MSRENLIIPDAIELKRKVTEVNERMEMLKSQRELLVQKIKEASEKAIKNGSMDDLTVRISKSEHLDGKDLAQEIADELDAANWVVQNYNLIYVISPR